MFPLRYLPHYIVGIAIGVILCWVGTSFLPPKIPSAENPIGLYSTEKGDDLRALFLTGINNARKSLLLIIYAISDRDIIQAIRSKSEENIPVTVICDAKASSRSLRLFGPKVRLIKCSSKGLMHQKILVVDEILTWIGSANMTTESLRVHGNLVIGVHDKNFANAVVQRANSMEKQSDLNPYQAFDISGQPLSLSFLPEDDHAIDRVKKLIKSAQKTIRVAMFTWTRKDLAQEIVEANKRGIKTEIIIDHNAANGVSQRIVKLLKNGGVSVRKSEGSALLHHKFVYIDQTTLINGSANWTLAAFTKNKECFMILEKLTSTQKELLDTVWDIMVKESTPL